MRNDVKRGVGYLYRRALRPLLPKTEPVRYAGVALSRDRRWGDMRVPAFMRPHNVDDIADYEAGLAKAIASHVRTGDRVVVVGGGEGVTVTLAARAAGQAGSVICFEGAKFCVDRVLETVRRNGGSGRVEVRHAIVASNISVYGEEKDFAGSVVSPETLPDCDVLELDCEGAEMKILPAMTIRPRAILVETHGVFGAPTLAVAATLQRLGYAVEDLGWAEPSRLEECRAGDVRVLVGSRLGSA